MLGRYRGETNLIIPCIDLMGHKAVQLVQGKDKALEKTVDEALKLFEGFPLLHIIDLDAALGSGDNHAEVTALLARCRARVGGGIRSVKRARDLVDGGAEQLIVGSAAYNESGVNSTFLNELAREVGVSRIIVAIDSKGGQVAVSGWKSVLDRTPEGAMKTLAPFCAGYLCTNVDNEGLMLGTDLELFLNLRAKTDKTLIAAGGISTMSEIEALTHAGIEVALGMAVYTGRLDVGELRRKCAN
jgi:phosphoribosylformimino-5-aminoimidazole carboxamide ribotide isomerase